MSEKKVVARSGLVASAPWLLRKSKRHEGRWYFYNTDTKESTWSLSASLVSTQVEGEPDDSPPPVIPTNTPAVVQLPVLQSPKESPENKPISEYSSGTIPIMSPSNCGWEGSDNGAISGGINGGSRYRRASYGGSSNRTSSNDSSKSDGGHFSPMSAPIDDIHHPTPAMSRRLDAKSPPQLKSPWDSPLFYRHQNRDGSSNSPRTTSSLTPPPKVEVLTSKSSSMIPKGLSVTPPPRTNLGRSLSSHKETVPLISRTHLGRSMSTSANMGAPPLMDMVALSPHSTHRKLISDRKPLESPRMMISAQRPKEATVSGGGDTPPPQINRKQLLKSKSTDSFNLLDSSKESLKVLDRGQKVSEQSERLRLLSVNIDSANSPGPGISSPSGTPLSPKEAGMPYFALSPPMLAPTVLTSIRQNELESGQAATEDNGVLCISEVPINEQSVLVPPEVNHRSSAASHESLSLNSHTEDSDQEASQEISRFKVTNGLGSGGYSVVVLVEDVETLQPFAMKVIQKSRLTRSHDRRRIRNELKVLRDLKPCPFLEKCVSAFESKERIFFVMEFNSGGDLFFHLVRRVNTYNTGFKEGEVRLLLAEILLGLEHLHSHGYVHRDIKVENIMLDSRGHVKLIDFGLVYHMKNSELIEGSLGEPMSPTGSLIYMAPELLQHRKGGRHTDWWAVGVLAHELLTGRTPWSSLTNKAVIQKEISGMRVAPPAGISPAAGMFICALLHQVPSDRLGTNTSVRNASFFSSIDWDVAERLGLPPALPPSADVIYSGSVGSSFDSEESSEVLKTYLSGCDESTEESKETTHVSKSHKKADHLFTLGLPRVNKCPSMINERRDQSGDGDYGSEQFGWDDDEDDLYTRRTSSITGGDSWPSSK